MKKKVCSFIMFFAVVLIVQSCTTNKSEYNPDVITKEILAKYNELSGVVDDSKIDLWDTYFLNHPNVGNTYDNITNCGWETVHQALIKDKSLPSNERFVFELSDITVHPINKNTAWVKGKIKLTFPEGKINNYIFYDSLIKTIDGWRVFNSVVNSIEK
ncbi:MAG: hypothetical protein KKG99_07440 [Bacteroidetes bacterium]|nr:hypothetical protein [Bacteroidota bacterium]